MHAKTDPRFDSYLAAAPDFARPLLTHLRALVHQACPEIQEAMKWGHPSFLLGGKLLCSMAAFKAHCRFGFWHDEMSAHIARSHRKSNDGPGQFGHITSRADLPDDATLSGYLAEGIRLNTAKKPAGPKRSEPKPARRPELPMPAEFSLRLKGNPAAARTFAELAPSHQREYLEWIIEAKREETREKRMAVSIEQLSQGKQRHWQYQKRGAAVAAA